MALWHNLWLTPALIPTQDNALRRAQVDLTNRNGPLGLLAQALAWLGIVGLVWRQGHSEVAPSIAAAAFCAMAIQPFSTRHFRRAVATRPITDRDITIIFLAVGWVGGCYAIAYSQIDFPQDLTMIAFQCAVMAGMASAGVASFCCIPAVAAVFVVILLLPGIVNLAMSGSAANGAIAFLAIVYLGLLFFFIVQGFRSFFESVRLRLENIDLLAESQSANRAKSEFLATISHEIRTPMSGILGMLRLILADRLSPAQRHRLELANDAAQSLMTVINDVLDWSAIENGSITLHAENCDLRALIEGVANLMRAKAEDKKLSLTVAVDSAVPQHVLIDPGRLRQMLLNLIGNAVKFTAAGGVTVEAAMARNGDLRIAVTDTGIGISPAVLGRLFQRFSQADQSISRSYGGSGLGLAITRELAALMGGEVGVDSVVGRGSTFWMSIPSIAAGSSAPPEPVAALPSVAPMELLLAEDNEINRLFLHQILLQAGHRVALAENGRQAVTEATAKRYDAILMDVQMPEIDGLAAAREIRRLPQPYQNVPIIALTANAGKAHEDVARAAGMDDFISKPVDIKALFAALERTRTLLHHLENRAIGGFDPA